MDLDTIERIEAFGELSEILRYCEHIEGFGDRYDGMFERQRDRLMGIVNATSGVDVLRALCDAKEAPFNAVWLKQQRGIVATRPAMTPALVDAMSVAEFAASVKDLAYLTSPTDSAATNGDASRTSTPTANGAKVLEALLGEETSQIMAVARSAKSADVRMREICEIDRRCLGWDSPRWSELLSVSDAMIRKTAFWKVDRQKAIEALREIDAGRD